jgi:drug/metabolite transporter (DMT)-like permease
MTRLVSSVALLLIVAVWGWTFSLVKVAIDDYGVLPFLAIRFSIATLVLSFATLGKVGRRELKIGGLIGIILAAAYLLQTFGLADTTASNSGLITGLFIVFVPLANWLLFGARTKLVLWLAIGVSVLGMAMLLFADGGTAVTKEAAHPLRGALLTLGAAACLGLHVALLERFSSGCETRSLTLGQMGGAALVLVLIASTKTGFAMPSGEVWLALIVTGVIASAVGFFVQTYAQKTLTAIETAMIIMLEPLFAVLFGYWLDGDRFGPWQMFGAVLMISAVTVAEFYPLLTRRFRKEEGTANEH